MKNTLLTTSLILCHTFFSIFSANKLSAGSHELEIAIQNCHYAKKFASIVMQKRETNRPLSYYQQIDFTSPVAMEIILEAYNTVLNEPEFSDRWFDRCSEISCSEFWADLEVSIKLVSD